MAFLKDTKIDGNLYVEKEIRASQALSYTSTGGGESSEDGFGFPRYEDALVDNIAKFAVVSGQHDGKFTSAILNETSSTYAEDPINSVNNFTISFEDKNLIIRNAANMLFRNGEINIAKTSITDSTIHFYYKSTNGSLVEQQLSDIGTKKVPNPHNAYGFYYEKPAL